MPYEPASYHFPLAFSERLSASLSWLSEVAAPPVVRWCSGSPGDAGVICSALDAMPTELVAEGTAVLIVDVEQSPTAPLRLDVSFALPDVGTP